MKTTKKLLIILCASALLVTTVFSVVLGAVVAGEGTSMNEYLTMKLSEFEDFEDNAKTIFGNSINFGGGKIVNIDSFRKAPSHVYDDEQTFSFKYYLMDYYENSSGADGYIQPVLGRLDNIDKTPVNGFVSEFDIAFFSPVEYEMVPKTEQMVDEDGNLLWEYDENGDILKDEAGIDVPKVQAVKKPVYDPSTGEPVMDPDNPEEQLTEVVMTPKLEYVKDAKGKVVFNAQGAPLQQQVVKSVGDFKGLTSTLYVNVLNTETFKDGSINSVVFKTYAKPDNPDELPDGFDAEYKDTGYIEMYCNEANPNLDPNLPGVYKFRPDEWIHLSFQYDAKSLMMHIYVGTDNSNQGNGRLLVASVSALDPEVENKNNAESPVYPLRFRLGSSSKSGYVGYDNFISYQGETIRDPDALNKMSPNEILELYVGILDNAGASKVDRYQAYIDLKENIMHDYKPGDGTSDSMNACIDTFYKYDNDVDGCKTQLISEVKLENAATFVEYVNAIGSIDRNLSNTAQREVKINMAREFHDACGNLIDRNSDAYVSASAVLKDYQDKVEKDKQANAFIDAMLLYENAKDFGASITRIKSHYEAANALRALITNYTDFAADSDSYLELKHATDLYDGSGSQPSAADYINSIVLNDNSRRFVNYMNLFAKTSEAEWAKDDGTLENIWYMALTVKRDEGYNASYSGMSTALEIFERVNTYFWGALQAKHVAILNEKLSAFDGADSNYIFKAGVCTYVTNYITLNAKDIDSNNGDIKSIIERNSAYEAQLGVLMEDYKNLLVQNATKFVNTMKLVEQYRRYDDVKPLFDEATEYYYTMDLIGEGIDTYTAKYEELRTKLAEIEASNSTFLAIVNGELTDAEGNVVYVALADATSKGDLYRTLNALSEYLGKLDETYEGVSEALELYNEKYEEYVGEAKTVNSQITETVDTTLAVRGNWDIDSVIAFVKKLFYR